MSSDKRDQFEGFQITDQKNWQDFKKQKFPAKTFGSNDIDIQIECCGVCGSDVHTITGGWGESPMPLCVGHEVVGKAVRVGDKVTTIKEGDRVGVGAQIWSCLKCPQCKSDNENYCPNMVDTYGAPYPKSECPHETISQGGYASHIRAHEYFTFQIPDAIPSNYAASMLCAGLTVWSPLVRAGVGPGKKVGVVGVGGLGHFALMWANALGAEVSALSHTAAKKEDALKLGAKEFILTTGDNWADDHKFKFDFVLNSADMTHEFDMSSYLGLCKVNGTFHHVGLPDKPLENFQPQLFMPNGCAMAGSHIGNRPEMIKMLKLAADQQLFPMIETIPISAEGCKEAVTKVKNNDVRYRVILTDFDKAFGA